MKKVLIIGSGLGGIATALRLSTLGYEVEIVEKHHRPGGRLNLHEEKGFRFDLGPSFFSMSYEFTELAEFCGFKIPFEFQELDPLYSIYFADRKDPYLIHKQLNKLATVFESIEPNFRMKLERYLNETAKLFHDTENLIIKRNFSSFFDYASALMQVPLGHAPKLLRTFWQEMERHFDSREVKEILSLVAFFLGGTPFNTPAVFTLLSYTELLHDGYYNVKGGMYKIVEGLVGELQRRNIPIHCHTEIAHPVIENGTLKAFADTNGKHWAADLFVSNADAAFFRGKIMQRSAFRPEKLDQMNWTMAPLTIYLGIKGKLNGVHHHNYFLGKNFKDYAHGIFKNKVTLDKPYYYLNVLSQQNPDAAPEGCESLFILVPVPDLRFKPNWSDAPEIINNLLEDLSQRIEYDLIGNRVTQHVMTPVEWRDTFDLYRGSGLGLGHNLGQMGYFRPSNTDEVHSNLFYVGASTTPGTGLPMVIIGSKLTTQQIQKKYGSF